MTELCIEVEDVTKIKELREERCQRAYQDRIVEMKKFEREADWDCR